MSWSRCLPFHRRRVQSDPWSMLGKEKKIQISGIFQGVIFVCVVFHEVCYKTQTSQLYNASLLKSVPGNRCVWIVTSKALPHCTPKNWVNLNNNAIKRFIAILRLQTLAMNACYWPLNNKITKFPGRTLLSPEEENVQLSMWRVKNIRHLCFLSHSLCASDKVPENWFGVEKGLRRLRIWMFLTFISSKRKTRSHLSHWKRERVVIGKLVSRKMACYFSPFTWNSRTDFTFDDNSPINLTKSSSLISRRKQNV